jgi:hypothetical protein
MMPRMSVVWSILLQDRATGLRSNNVFEPHRYLHQISSLAIERLIKSADGGRAECKSNYLVIRTMLDGTMSSFSAGVYLDKITLGRTAPDWRSGCRSRIRAGLRCCWSFRYNKLCVCKIRLLLLDGCFYR